MPSIKGGKLLRKATKKSIPLNFEISIFFFNLLSFFFFLSLFLSPPLLPNNNNNNFLTRDKSTLFEFDKTRINFYDRFFFFFILNLKTTSEGFDEISNSFLRIRTGDALLVRHDIQTKRIRKLI